MSVFNGPVQNLPVFLRLRWFVWVNFGVLCRESRLTMSRRRGRLVAKQADSVAGSAGACFAPRRRRLIVKWIVE